MNAVIRRIAEVVARALGFGTANPDTSPGFLTATARLVAIQAELQQFAAEQVEGIGAERAASGRKQDLRRGLEQTELAHLVHVAAHAADVLPELGPTFRITRENHSYLAFRTGAQTMVDAARAHLDVLVAHGLAEPVLASLEQKLSLFDQVTEDGSAARRQHVRAGRALEALANEAMQVVRVLDGIHRFRFAKDAGRLAAWQSAINVLGPIRPVPAAPAGGEGEVPKAEERVS